MRTLPNLGELVLHATADIHLWSLHYFYHNSATALEVARFTNELRIGTDYGAWRADAARHEALGEVA
jgi:hypothetical protein